MSSRLVLYPSEAQRLGLAPEQVARLRAIRPAPPPAMDAARLNSLFKAYERAAEGPAKEAAAQPLLTEARRFGEAAVQSARDELTRYGALVTPRQWKLLTYDPPDDAGGEAKP